MGASGTGPFENDGALDLCDELSDLDSENVHDRLRASLATVAQLDEAEYLEKEEGEAAVAAAAIVAARKADDDATLRARGLDEVVPAELDDLVDVAIAALMRVMGEESELAELWADTGQEDEWRDGVKGIVNALRGSS